MSKTITVYECKKESKLIDFRISFNEKTKDWSIIRKWDNGMVGTIGGLNYDKAICFAIDELEDEITEELEDDKYWEDIVVTKILPHLNLKQVIEKNKSQE